MNINDVIKLVSSKDFFSFVALLINIGITVALFMLTNHLINKGWSVKKCMIVVCPCIAVIMFVLVFQPWKF